MRRPPQDGQGPFKDHFSHRPAEYARFRPRYPAALFELLAARAPGRGLAWDCGTGNGQAAAGLAARFARVVATDASLPQLADGAPAAGVSFVAARAESVPLAGGEVDLVTAAAAIHWFDLEAFYAEVRRVARPGALLAAWVYPLLSLGDGTLDAAIGRFFEHTVGPCWPPERRWVERRYRGLPFPFARQPVPELEIEERWPLAHLLGYLATWSSVARYRRIRGEDPLPALAAELARAWGDAERPRRVVWPLALLLGRIS